MTKLIPNRFPYVLFTCLMGLDVTVFLIEKITSTTATGEGMAFLRNLIAQPSLAAMLVLKLMQLWIWTRILATVNISLAFPLTSIGYPLTMLAAVFLLHEKLSWQVWLGGGLITVGAAILGYSEEPAAIDDVADNAPQTSLV
jgi:undecaprenyl phosphate-alpha-L-ara4N flippase subunit ArnE